MQLSVDGFAEGAAIPERFTCDGENISPALRRSGEPEATRSLALIMDDPDAPAGTWNHWLVWDISRSRQSFAEGDGGVAAKAGTNYFGGAGYGGPCPGLVLRAGSLAATSSACLRSTCLRSGWLRESNGLSLRVPIFSGGRRVSPKSARAAP